MVLGDEPEPLMQPEDTKITVDGGIGAKFEKGTDEVRVEVGQKQIGLTKEELEKYRNDPFWKRMRFVLFVAFWLLWVAMFSSAILIVVFSPRCQEKQQVKWWQSKVSYQLLVPTFYDSNGDGVGDIQGVTAKLDLLRKVGVTTIYPSPVLETPKDDFFDTQAITNHAQNIGVQVDGRFGSDEDLKALVDAAHDRGMFVVMDVPLTSVSNKHKWMTDSHNPHRNEAFYWKTVGAGEKNPPGYYDAPATGGKKYLGYPDAAHPVLNWNSDFVKKEIKSAIHRLLDMGVDGFNLDHVSRLAVDESGRPNHDKSIEKLAELTADIRSYIQGKEDLKEKEIALFSSLMDMEELHARVTETRDLHYVVDNSFTKLNTNKCGGKTAIARCIHIALTMALDRKAHDGFTPFWQFSSPSSSRLSNRFDAQTAHLLTFMQLTLPGAINLYYGQELGLRDGSGPGEGQHGIMQWTPKSEGDVDDHHGFVGNDKSVAKLFFPEATESLLSRDNFETQYSEEKSPLKVFRTLMKLRQREEVLIVGDTLKDEMQGDIIIFSRFLRSSNSTSGPVYVVALNFGDKDQAVDMTRLSSGVIPFGSSLANAEVSAVTPDMENMKTRTKVDLERNTLELPAKQAVLLRL